MHATVISTCQYLRKILCYSIFLDSVRDKNLSENNKKKKRHHLIISSGNIDTTHLAHKLMHAVGGNHQSCKWGKPDLLSLWRCCLCLICWIHLGQTEFLLSSRPCVLCLFPSVGLMTKLMMVPWRTEECRFYRANSTHWRRKSYCYSLSCGVPNNKGKSQFHPQQYLSQSHAVSVDLAASVDRRNQRNSCSIRGQGRRCASLPICLRWRQEQASDLSPNSFMNRGVYMHSQFADSTPLFSLYMQEWAGNRLLCFAWSHYLPSVPKCRVIKAPLSPKRSMMPVESPTGKRSLSLSIAKAKVVTLLPS